MKNTNEWETVDALADDPTVIATLQREAIIDAVKCAASENNGLVAAAAVRAAMKRPVAPHRIGAVISGLVKRGVLVDTGMMAPSGDRRNRNSRRRLPVWRLVDEGAL